MMNSNLVRFNTDNDKLMNRFHGSVLVYNNETKCIMN